MNARRLVRWVVIVTLLATLVSLALPALAQFPTQQVATVTAWRLNVRAAPGIYARVLAVISRYEVYPAVNSLPDQSWIQIRLNSGTLGWVSGRYVRLSSVQPLPIYTPTPLPFPTPIPTVQSCNSAFFFSNRDRTVCPIGNAASVQAALERFERGFMVWLGSTGEVYVFSNSGVRIFPESVYAPFPDPTPETPPSYGYPLYQPIRGFGRVWHNMPGVRDLLGWGTQPESGYTAQVQQGRSTSGDVFTYIMLQDGSVVAVNPYRGYWWTAS